MNLLQRCHFYGLLSLLFIGCTNKSFEPEIVEIEKPVKQVINWCEWPVEETLTEHSGLIIKSPFSDNISQFKLEYGIVYFTSGNYKSILIPCSLPQSFMKDSLQVVFSGKVKYRRSFYTGSDSTAKVSSDLAALPVEIINISLE